AVTLQPTQPITDSEFHWPQFGQIGKRVAVHGPFGGDFRNTQVFVNGAQAELVTETATNCVFQWPQTITPGPANVQLVENGVPHNIVLRVFGVTLSSPVTTLPRGASTEITATVTGLDGYDLLKNPLYILQQILTPTVVLWTKTKADISASDLLHQIRPQ